MSDRPKQKKIFEDIDEDKSQEPVECLGMTFENDEKRREFYLEKLREKLKDPEFRKIEGFPIGEDEDILALSDPPYYTACPNPFITEFIKYYGKSYDKQDYYFRQPFAADISVGKNDPLYNVHSYHTKVPHKAIMQYILHYTKPGDIVLDGFCGTGMTGVAAMMCGDERVVESLGFKVKPDGLIFQKESNEDAREEWVSFSKLGKRRAVLNDLSPAATFIASNYNKVIDIIAFKEEAKHILEEIEKECGWLYETKHEDGRTGKINYTVWSDIFICPECSGEVVFWDAAIDKKACKVQNIFPCPNCKASLTKRKMERAWLTKYDTVLESTIKHVKQTPVLINYTISGKRFKKKPDNSDLALIEKIENSTIPYWFPTNRMMEGGETRRNDPIGMTHIHHFYTKRNLWFLSALWNKSSKMLKFGITNILSRNATRLNRFIINKHNPLGRINGPMTGTLYVPSEQVEQSVSQLFEDKILKNGWQISENIISTSSFSNVKQLNENSIDYIFIDPPFGANINYSELNFLWESWLGVVTDIVPEAIENTIQGKDLTKYRQLMIDCFKEAYRVLKPGHWMTVEFSNTKASVWNSIQTALTDAGFIVANVSALDKKHGGIRAMFYAIAVKQDLIISAYKPNGGFEDRFQCDKEQEYSWDFIRTHMKYLPVIKKQSGKIFPVPERDPRILFDQMVAYYVQKGYPVPISSQDFQIGLTQHFPERDGMYFLPEQVAEYDKRCLTVKEMIQLKLFISDESSAIQWLKQQLNKKPQTFQDIHPQFLKEIGGWQKHEKPLELSELLEQNFIRYDAKDDVPSQIHSYLSSNYRDLRNLEKNDPTLKAKAKDRWYVPDPNKAGDLEKLRERSLLKEFEEYRTSKQKRLKVFRLEAIRAGFKKAWQERDYSTIISVAQKIPEKSLQEDPKLLMWYDQALTRSGEDQ